VAAVSRRLILLVSHSVAAVSLFGIVDSRALVSIAQGSEKESTHPASDSHGAQLEETDGAAAPEASPSKEGDAKPATKASEDSQHEAAVGEESQEALVPAHAPAETESSVKGIVWFAVVFVMLVTVIYLFL
jgi:hypothetical protein